jgi:acyl-CoA dehydrogenase
MLISRGGDERVREEFLHDATAGKKIGALGVSESNAGSDVAAIRTRAVRDGDDYIVNGSKTFITNGTIADYITTAVRTGDPGYGGILLLVIPADTAGLSRSRLKKIGTHASDTAELAFEDCRSPGIDGVAIVGTGGESRGL